MYLLAIYCIIVIFCSFFNVCEQGFNFSWLEFYPHGVALEFHFWVLNFQSTQEEYVIFFNVLKFDSYDF
jgi:hypothetical protein